MPKSSLTRQSQQQEAQQESDTAATMSNFKYSRSTVFILLVSSTLILNQLRAVNLNAIMSAQVLQEQQQEQTRSLLQDEQTPPSQLPESLGYDTVTSDNRHASSASSSPLPSCPALMQASRSPYRDGAFLTRQTIPVSWVPRADGSRELQHSWCQLHRYTANEARQCLAGKHVNIIGDSLSRYQFMSLAWFLHRGHYPPHFGRGFGECTHLDEQGQPTCSPENEPNICMEGDWQRGNPIGDPWRWLMQSAGGGMPSNNIFDGHLEASAIRTKQTKGENVAENYLYVSPPLSQEGEHTKEHQQSKKKQLLLSYFSEIGWGDSPQPLAGFDFTGCGAYGNCSFSNELADQRLARGMNQQWDFSQPLADALNQTNGVLYTHIPPVDISLYNRGLWGTLSKTQATKLMPLFHQFSQGTRGRCFYRSTTGKFEETMPVERTYVRSTAGMAGCGYIDFAHLVKDFNQLLFWHPHPPLQNVGNDTDKAYDGMTERDNVYWDAVHFMPWVYEELNNMLLNVWCNLDLPLSTSETRNEETVGR